MKNNRKTGISVIVVSWNTKDVTDECLAHLNKARDFIRERAECEVVVVDNASSDGTPEMILQKYPWVELVRSGSNLGYAKGNNFGFKRLNPKNEYLLLLNSDVYVENETLAHALDYFENHPECDVLGCRLISQKGKLQSSAGDLPTPTNILSWIWGLDLVPVVKKLFKQFHPRYEEFFGENKEVGWVQGAFVFMKREVFEKTNGFDENLFMYMDEVEWCKRVAGKGFKIFYTPSFSVVHLDRASAQGIPEKMAKTYSLEIEGVIYYLKKYYKDRLGLLLPIIKLGILIRWLTFLIMGRTIRSQAYLTAFQKI